MWKHVKDGPQKVTDRVPHMRNIVAGEIRNLELWDTMQTEVLTMLHGMYANSDIGKTTWNTILEAVHEAHIRYRACTSPPDKYRIVPDDMLSRYQRIVAEKLWEKFETNVPFHFVERAKKNAIDRKDGTLARVEELIYFVGIVCIPQGKVEKKKLIDNFVEGPHFKAGRKDLMMQIDHFKTDLEMLEKYKIFRRDYDYSELFTNIFNEFKTGNVRHYDDTYKDDYLALIKKYYKLYADPLLEDETPRKAIFEFLDEMFTIYSTVTDRNALHTSIRTEPITPPRQLGQFDTKKGDSSLRQVSSLVRDAFKQGSGWRSRSNSRERYPSRSQSTSQANKDSKGNTRRSNVRRTTADGEDSYEQDHGEQAHDDSGEDRCGDVWEYDVGNEDLENCDNDQLHVFYVTGEWRPLDKKPKVWDKHNCCTERECPRRKDRTKDCRNRGKDCVCTFPGCEVGGGHTKFCCYKAMPWLSDEHREARGAPRQNDASSRRPSASSNTSQKSQKSGKSDGKGRAGKGKGKGQGQEAPKSPKVTSNAPKSADANKSPAQNLKSPRGNQQTQSGFGKGAGGHPSLRR